jgi:hypothetical protein
VYSLIHDTIANLDNPSRNLALEAPRRECSFWIPAVILMSVLPQLVRRFHSQAKEKKAAVPSPVYLRVGLFYAILRSLLMKSLPGAQCSCQSVQQCCRTILFCDYQPRTVTKSFIRLYRLVFPTSRAVDCRLPMYLFLNFIMLPFCQCAQDIVSQSGIRLARAKMSLLFQPSETCEQSTTLPTVSESTCHLLTEYGSKIC